LNGDYSYECESCGATLWDLWDVTSAGGAYSCGVCGHDLDDQDGAKKTYMYG
jgi:DNA-directed RNA polymerase subunit RPC12/RpoP